MCRPAKLERPAYGVMPTQVESKDDPMSLVQFFDWDDTLYPSTYMAGRSILPYGGSRLPADLVEPFKVLTESIVSLFTLALSQGDVVIVTNADHGWVELCVKLFMPELKETMIKVRVLSARALYEHVAPEYPIQWKIHTFRQMLMQKVKDSVGFGDNVEDSEALIRAAGDLGLMAKAIKTKTKPSLETLIEQMKYILSDYSALSRVDCMDRLDISGRLQPPIEEPIQLLVQEEAAPFVPWKPFAKKKEGPLNGAVTADDFPVLGVASASKKVSVLNYKEKVDALLEKEAREAAHEDDEPIGFLPSFHLQRTPYWPEIPRELCENMEDCWDEEDFVEEGEFNAEICVNSGKGCR